MTEPVGTGLSFCPFPDASATFLAFGFRVATTGHAVCCGMIGCRASFLQSFSLPHVGYSLSRKLTRPIAHTTG